MRSATASTLVTVSLPPSATGMHMAMLSGATTCEEGEEASRAACDALLAAREESPARYARGNQCMCMGVS